jgi:hypothetical protein
VGWKTPKKYFGGGILEPFCREAHPRRELRKPQGVAERLPARVMRGFISALLKERVQELEKKGLLPKGK